MLQCCKNYRVWMCTANRDKTQKFYFYCPHIKFYKRGSRVWKKRPFPTWKSGRNVFVVTTTLSKLFHSTDLFLHDKPCLHRSITDKEINETYPMNSPDPTSQINLALFAYCVVHLRVPLSIKSEVHPRSPVNRKIFYI